MTQKELALQAGFIPRTVRAVETNRSTMFITDVYRLAEALGISAPPVLVLLRGRASFPADAPAPRVSPAGTLAGGIEGRQVASERRHAASTARRPLTRARGLRRRAAEDDPVGHVVASSERSLNGQ